MKSTYLGHSGFCVEVSSATLIFDWVQGELPRIRLDKPVFFFISHVHSDHFSTKVFKRAEILPKVEIYLGYDNSNPKVNKFLKTLPDRVAAHLHCVNGFNRILSEDGNTILIQTLKSTDLGVAFLLEVGEETIFHAGDLYLMQSMNKEDYRRWYGEMLVNEPGTPVMDYESQFIHHNNEFFAYTEPLRDKIIDFGMIPLDPRVEGVAHKTLMRYLSLATFRSWSPMHLWGRYEFVEKFCHDYPEISGEMVPFREPEQYEFEPEQDEHIETSKDNPDVLEVTEAEETAVAFGRMETFDAWGPKDRALFTCKNRAPYVTFNSITDNPEIGDERNFVRIRNASKRDDKFVDKVELQEGKVYEVAIWFHNDADPNGNLDGSSLAKDVYVRVDHAPTVERNTSGEIVGLIGASNTNPGRVWDKAYMHADFNAAIRIIPNSAEIRCSGSCNRKPLSHEELFGAGAKLGYSSEKMGELLAGSAFSGYVTYRFAVMKA